VKRKKETISGSYNLNKGNVVYVLIGEGSTEEERLSKRAKTDSTTTAGNFL